MAIDLQKGISIRIEGELGKYQTLPINSLIKIAESLQELILSIAKYDLPTDMAVDLDNFKIELTDFKKASAIPSFIFTPRVQLTTSGYENQRNEVNKKLNTILKLSDSGRYSELKNLYPEHSKRTEIVKKLYDFTAGFGNSPTSIYENNKEDKTRYQPKKFNSKVKESLIVKVNDVKEIKEEEQALGRIKITKQGSKMRKSIEEVISINHHSLSYSPDVINVNNKQYVLHFPLRCLFEKEEDYYVINNEQLDIIGTGLTPDEAEFNFNEEFDYLYNRLNTMGDEKLSEKLLRIKGVLNSFVKEVS